MLDPVHWTLLSFGCAGDAEDGVATTAWGADDSGKRDLDQKRASSRLGSGKRIPTELGSVPSFFALT